MRIIIIGAGPTGLTAAIELARHGISVRVIDRKAAPSPLSRAVGINPNSLRLLEPSGVTQKLLEKGVALGAGQIHDGGRIAMTLHMHLLPPPYNFLLSLPQDQTEHVMIDCLQALGGTVEFNTELMQLVLQDAGTAQIVLSQNGKTEEVIADLVIAADGAHSVVRQILNIPFDGYDRSELWSIADVVSPGFPWDHDVAHMFVHDSGLGVTLPIGQDRYRVVSTAEQAIDRIPQLRENVTQVYSDNNFHIAVRQARQYRKGCVYLAGDAAHTHTPAGGLGMNTGIADACDLAARIAAGDTSGYAAARHAAGKKVIAISENLAHMATTRNPLLKILRRCAFFLLDTYPILQKPMLRRVAGVK